MNDSKFIRVNLSVGQWIYHLFLLQILPIFYTLKGFVLFGLFPAIASLFNVFYQWMAFGKVDLSITKTFKQFYKKYFWQANKLGWAFTTVGAVLLFDLYISSTFIQSVLLHHLLLLLFFMYIVISSYLFPVFARYDYTNLTAYIRQAFYIGFASIFQSIAILLAIVVVSVAFTYIPFLYLFFGVPILFGAIAWFAIQGILKAETMSKMKEGE